MNTNETANNIPLRSQKQRERTEKKMLSTYRKLVKTFLSCYQNCIKLQKRNLHNGLL